MEKKFKTKKEAYKWVVEHLGVEINYLSFCRRLRHDILFEGYKFIILNNDNPFKKERNLSPVDTPDYISTKIDKGLLHSNHISKDIEESILSIQDLLAKKQADVWKSY